MQRIIRVLSMLSCCAMLVACASEYKDTDGSTISSSAYANLISRGILLRKALDEAYATRKRAKLLQSEEGKDLTEIVIAAIPIGSKFSEAKIILRAAGFDKGQTWYGYASKDGLTVRAFIFSTEINHYDGFLFDNTSMGVTITPDDYETWATVKTLSAGISTVFL